MSTFDGVIREFPTLAIDNFVKRPGVNVWLLSHVHEDHLRGLQSKLWNSPIYCSRITARLLPLLASRSSQVAFENGEAKELKRKYSHLAPFLRPLENETPHYLDLGNGRKVRCTPIPAHHCPGSVMFLLQDEQYCILYTGDCRNEAEDLIGLRQMPIFANASLAKTFDRLYLDTTCCHTAFREFPPRQQVVGELIQFIDRRPRMAHYYIDAWTFGYEEIWVGLSRAFNSKIHVSRYLYELYGAIDEFLAEKIQPHLTLDGRTARFHSCRLGPDCGYGAGIQSGNTVGREVIRIQPNVSWFSAVMQQGRGLGGQAPLLDSVFEGKVAGRSTRFSIQERIPPSLSRRDRHFYYLNFAFHSSLTELEQLVALIGPQALFPCVPHQDPDMCTYRESAHQVAVLLGHHVHNKTRLVEDTENVVPERLRQWQIQQRHRRDGMLQDRYQVLELDEAIAVDDRSVSPRSRSAFIPFSPSKDKNGSLIEVKGNPLLSPRSRHLQKKMEKLKRQLTRAKSEETDLQRKDRVSQSSGSGSSLSAGPLTLDMDVLERKRLWWLQEDREQSTTQEDTEEEEDEEENGDVGKHIVHENHALADTCIFPDTQQKPPEHAHQRQQDEWLELSTVELSRTKLEEAEVPTENHPSKVPPSSIASLNSPFHENSQAVASTVLSSSAEGSQAPSLSSGSCYQDTAMTPSALDSSPPRSSASAPQTYGLELDKQQQQLHNFGTSDGSAVCTRSLPNIRRPKSRSVRLLMRSSKENECDYCTISASPRVQLTPSSHRPLDVSGNIFTHVALSPPRRLAASSTTGKHTTNPPLPLARSSASSGHREQTCLPSHALQKSWQRTTAGEKRPLPFSPPKSRQARGKARKQHCCNPRNRLTRKRTQNVDLPSAKPGPSVIWIESSSSSDSSSEGEDETTTCDHSVRFSAVDSQGRPGVNAGLSAFIISASEQKASLPIVRAPKDEVQLLDHDEGEERWLEYQDLV